MNVDASEDGSMEAPMGVPAEALAEAPTEVPAEASTDEPSSAPSEGARDSRSAEPSQGPADAAHGEARPPAARPVIDHAAHAGHAAPAPRASSTRAPLPPLPGDDAHRSLMREHAELRRRREERRRRQEEEARRLEQADRAREESAEQARLQRRRQERERLIQLTKVRREQDSLVAQSIRHAATPAVVRASVRQQAQQAQQRGLDARPDPARDAPGQAPADRVRGNVALYRGVADGKLAYRTPLYKRLCAEDRLLEQRRRDLNAESVYASFVRRGLYFTPDGAPRLAFDEGYAFTARDLEVVHVIALAKRNRNMPTVEGFAGPRPAGLRARDHDHGPERGRGRARGHERVPQDGPGAGETDESAERVALPPVRHASRGSSVDRALTGARAPLLHHAHPPGAATERVLLRGGRPGLRFGQNPRVAGAEPAEGMHPDVSGVGDAPMHSNGAAGAAGAAPATVEAEAETQAQAQARSRKHPAGQGARAGSKPSRSQDQDLASLVAQLGALG